MLEARIKELLLPHDPNEGRNVIIEIQGTEGGEEANLWAGDLYRMYQRFAERHGLKIEVLSSQPSEHGGYRDITFLVKGDDAWSRFKYEGGPHRVQRVPATESQGRIHTSAATVAVLPEAEDIDVEIDPERPRDRRVPRDRSRRAVGEHHRLRGAASRTSRPGSSCRARTRRASCRTRTRRCGSSGRGCCRPSRIASTPRSSAARRDQVKGGGRSEKIRTYNYKENRLTDHRIPITLHSLDRVLDGELDDVVDALAADERARQLGGE